MNLRLTSWLAASLAALASQSAGAADLHVVTSIKPIQSLVAMVMESVSEPALIVKGAASPHAYSMKPSDAEALAQANVVFWGGHQLEHFLEKPLSTLGANARAIALLDEPTINKLKPRDGGTFEPDRDGDADHAEGDAVDPHFWLDPENGRAALQIIASTLEQADPANAARYADNATKADASLRALETSIGKELEPVKGKPFIVFHDAYHYFEARFGVRAAGSITVSPDVQPGAARIAEMEDKIRSLGAVCIFSEPQFEPKLVDTVAAGSHALKGVLDPVGADLADGPSLYPTLLQNLAANLKDCLNKES